MKIFISCSGDTSYHIGEALRDWLPTIIQAVKPWVSSKDIEKGSRWGSDIAKQLEEAQFGIICLTKDNLAAPWILFEAGALSKAVGSSYVCPYLLHLNPLDIKGPMSLFQATKAAKDDTKSLLESINQRLDEKSRVSKEVLDKSFERGWPELEKTLLEIPSEKGEKKTERNERDLLEEILSIVRNLEREKPSDPLTRLLAVRYIRALGPARLQAIRDKVKEGDRVTPSLAPSKAKDQAEDDPILAEIIMRAKMGQI